MAFESKFQSRVPDDSMPDSYYQKGVNGFLSQMGLSCLLYTSPSPRDA